MASTKTLKLQDLQWNFRALDRRHTSLTRVRTGACFNGRDGEESVNQCEPPRSQFGPNQFTVEVQLQETLFTFFFFLKWMQNRN